MEILEIKSAMSEMKISLDRLGRRSQVSEESWWTLKTDQKKLPNLNRGVIK